jgi:hypothetical protein
MKCSKKECINTAKKGLLYCSPCQKAKNKTTVKYAPKIKATCHNGNPLIADVNGVKIYAGGSSRSGGWWKMLPYPDLAIGPDSIVYGHGPKPIDPRWGQTQSSKYYSEQLPILIGLDWPDFGLPKNTSGKTMPREFWYALVSDIHEQGIKTISTQCMGGHGRTGVSLSILLHLLTPESERTWVDLAGLLKHIHKVYCTQAVEGDEQAEYIAHVLNIEEGDYTLHHYRATNIGYGHNDYYGTGVYYGAKSTPTTLQRHCSFCKKTKPPSKFGYNTLSGQQYSECDDCFTIYLQNEGVTPTEIQGYGLELQSAYEELGLIDEPEE